MNNEIEIKKILNEKIVGDIKTYKNFVNENIIRQNFLKILIHLSKLGCDDVKIDEFDDGKGNTTSIQYSFYRNGDKTCGRVCYDWCGDIKPSVKDNIIFELWWSDECYCLMNHVNHMKNMLTVLLKKVKFEDYKIQYKTIRNDTLIPIPE